MTPLLCALNPGQRITIYTNARHYGQPMNAEIKQVGTVRRVHFHPTWGWFADVRGRNPLWQIAVPLEKIVGGVANLYCEVR